MPATITDPGTTAVWEQALDMIEAGDMTLETFVAKQSTWITQLVQQYRVATLAITLPEGPACPLCGSATRQRTGKTGAFWSCCRYPDCNGTLPVQNGRQASAKRSPTRKPRQMPK
ncbi:DNA topoisomerase 1 [compost metagenome]